MPHCKRWLSMVGSVMLWGCVGLSSPVDLSTTDPSQDQWRIAEYYSREAARFRQKSQDLYASALMYERLFGAASEWVSGARLLAQSYEDAASEREHLAQKHLEAAGAHRVPRTTPTPSGS